MAVNAIPKPYDEASTRTVTKLSVAASHEIGVVVVECAHYGSHHGECAYAAEQNGGGDAFGEVGGRDASRGAVHALVHLQQGAYESADRQTEDEKHGILCLLHALHRDVHT